MFLHEYIEHSLFAAMFRYRPSAVLDTDLRLIKLDPLPGTIPATNPTLGWEDRTTGEVILQKLPGNHDTWLVDHAGAFGAYLDESLDFFRSSNTDKTA